MYTWIKLYSEILDDPKMGMMNDHLWRRTIELFLLAGKHGKGGLLPPLQAMCWTLHASKADLQIDLDQLIEMGIIENLPDDYKVKNFEKRQAPMSGTERSRKSRASNAIGDTVQRSGNVFAGEVEEEEEVEVEEESTTTTSAPTKSPIYQLYEKNFGALTPMIAQTLGDLEEIYSKDWVMTAMSEAVTAEVRKLNYVAAILQRWKVDGFQTRKQQRQPQLQGRPTKSNAEIIADMVRV